MAKPLGTIVQMEELERLYRDEGARLERALVLFGGDRDIARDAVAETFAQAMKAGDRVRDPRSWVWRVAFRIAAGELKDRRRRASALPDEGYEMPEPVVDLVRALRQLSPKQRACVLSLPLRRLFGERSRAARRLDARGSVCSSLPREETTTRALGGWRR